LSGTGKAFQENCVNAFREIAAAAILLLALAIGDPVAAQQGADATERELAHYRSMMKADPWSNPGMLDVDRGEALWKTPRGPKNVSLEGCDLGLGPGKVDGAFAKLPRYFADADRVMDAEARILWCMETLQGFEKAKLIIRPHPGSGMPVKDLGAITTYVAYRSSGLKFAAEFIHPREKEMLALGETLFFRRSGPMDFACSTCHAGSGKRIRLQPLPFFSKAAEARKIVGEWPAYRVSTTHVMTMQHRIYDCFWQMRMPEVELGSAVSSALISYLVKQAQGGEINTPGMKR
jgi:L-cysteine S-thiosulfotransferase